MGIFAGHAGTSEDVKNWREGGRGSPAFAAEVQHPTVSPRPTLPQDDRAEPALTPAAQSNDPQIFHCSIP